MHTNVHCSTVYNSKDLEPTQMPINYRVDKENVAHIHHGILCSNQKQWVHVVCRDMDESGNHLSQQIDTGQKTKHHMLSLVGGCWIVRTRGHREGSIIYCGQSWGRLGERQRGVGRVGRDNEGRNTRYRWWGDEGSKPPWYLCNNPVWSAYVPHNLKYNLKKKGWVHVLCRYMGEAGNHHSQWTNTGTEKHCVFSLINGSWTMRTYGHREGNITHPGLSRCGRLEER